MAVGEIQHSNSFNYQPREYAKPKDKIDNIFDEQNSDIKKTDCAQNFTKEDIKELKNFVSSLSDEEIIQAQEVIDDITSKYINTKTATPYEQNLAWTLDLQVQSLSGVKEQFQQQQDNDGALRKGFDSFKALTSIGISSSDIKTAISQQEAFVKDLQKALNKEGDKTFEEVWLEYTGNEYSQEDIIEYQKNTTELQIYSSGIQKARAFEDSLNGYETFDEVFNAYCQYFGDEDLAREKLNEILKEAWGDVGYVINKDNTVTCSRQKNVLLEDDSSIETKTKSFDELGNLLQGTRYGFDLSKYEKEYNAQFEKITGRDPEQLTLDYYNSQKEALGKANAIQNLIDNYCASQDNFSNRMSNILQTAGFITIGTGVAMTFVPPLAGVAPAVVTAGNTVAGVGRFADNAIELADNLSSKNGLSKDEGYEIFKETVSEAFSTLANIGINKVSGDVADAVRGLRTINDVTLTAAQREALALLSEYGTDFTLSLVSDLIIEGKIDIKDDALTNVIGIFSGLSGAQLNQAKMCFEQVDSFISYGEMESAIQDFTTESYTLDTDSKEYEEMKELLDELRSFE